MQMRKRKTLEEGGMSGGVVVMVVVVVMVGMWRWCSGGVSVVWCGAAVV